ncbi:hypothetical protein JHK86_032361 [Glycine max]|nr:hypothetical protein JHK86_032361 [Glycine max]
MQHDILIKKLLLTHDPDGRRLDSETMLLAVGNIMFHTSTIIGAFNLYSASFQKNDITEIETIGCSEPVGFIITKIGKVLCRCSGEGDINSRIINLFDLIGKYSWDAKVVLVLAAFAVRYGEFWQLKQLYRGNALAALISNIKQLPNNLKPLKLQIKALSLLVKTMMDVAMCIIKFEYLPLQHVEPGNDIFLVRDTKSRIYEAAYWITRSCLACLINLLVPLRALTLVLVPVPKTVHFSPFTKLLGRETKTNSCRRYSDSAIIAAWELSSLAYRLSGICCNLRRQLRGSELKNKTVLLLISKPQLLNPIDIYLLVQQTCDHPLNERLRESYKIVWIPLPSSDTWTEAEESSFNFMSDSLPWNAVRKPRLLSSAVVKYIREQWNYKDEPIMVALDSKGKVTNYNALDMINIWGAQAYPFSASKEEELWQDQNLTMQLLLDGINPLLAYWVEQGKNICLYGSENLVWIQQFNDKITEIKRAGLQLETIYVGNSQSGENVKQIMARGGEKSLSDPLSFTNVQHFWVRLETMRRSKLRLGKTPSSDHVLAELSTLLDMDDREEGWAVIGCGGSSSTDILRLQGMQVMEFLRKCSEWRENITNLGLHGALRNFLDPHFVEGSCNHSYFVSSRENERPSQGTVMCQVCKRPMKNFVVYQP